MVSGVSGVQGFRGLGYRALGFLVHMTHSGLSELCTS